MDRRVAIILCLALACGGAVPSGRALADVFLLRSGGQLQGEWTNRDERKPSGHEVVTATGIRLRVAKDSVHLRVPEQKLEAEYERIAPLHANTVAEQWKIAEWCREHNLGHRRQGHLESILKLDSNHVAARRALGFQNHRGQWQTSAQHHRQGGYEMYRGRWRLVQDIEIQEERAAQHLAESEWLMKLKQWRKELASDRPWTAWQQFEEVNHPLAVPALQSLMAKEPSRKAKILYLDALYRIASGPAVQTLVQTALNDRDDEIFFETADRLKKLPPHIIEKPLLDSLRDPSNEKINRAAYLIGRTGNEKLVSPLIDALVSVHRQVNNNGGDTNSFGSNGSAGISRGGPTYVDIPVQNRFVLDALVELTGQNFDFDQRAWRRWYNIEKSRIFADSSGTELRRENLSAAENQNRELRD